MQFPVPLCTGNYQTACDHRLKAGLLRQTGQPPGFSGDGWGQPGNFPAGPSQSLHVLQELFLFDICLLENREQCTRGDLRMVWNRDKSPGFRMQEMNMAAGLAYRFETKNDEDFNYFKS